MKYLKWIFKEDVGTNQKFEIGKVNVCSTWDPNNSDWDKRGGFNFTNEECALRWMSRGDTLYEVELPTDAVVIEVKNDKTPGGIIVSNKIILKNPISISEDLLLDYYDKSNLPLTTYFECIGLLAARGFYDIALKIIKEKVTMDNIDMALTEFNSSIKPWHKVDYECYNKVKEILEEIKSDVDINLFIDKEPYIKKITEENVINVTGQSGSGKTTYVQNHFTDDKYLVVDTDDIFSEVRFTTSTGINKELGEYFRSKYEVLPNCGDDFDLIYKEILNYCNKYDKTIVIDCAQFHCIKNINLLKGTVIVIRTCIDNCYNRTISRYIKNKPDYTEEELTKYKARKKGVYAWYKSSNNFLEAINSMGKYLKVMFGNKGVNFEYKIDEVNIASIWNPNTYEPEKMGGFNFSTEDKILRWLVRGDTLYDVIIPEDAEIIDCPSESAPHGVFRSNKIILTNPRTMTDKLAMEFYLKSNLPEKSYYKSLAGVAIRGYENTALKIIEDRVNKDNIDLVLSEIEEFVKPEHSSGTASNGVEVYNEVINILENIKNKRR